MRIVEVKKQGNGAHRNQTVSELARIPNGWVRIPDSVVCDNFPFGDVVTEEFEGRTVFVGWIPCENTEEGEE